MTTKLKQGRFQKAEAELEAEMLRHTIGELTAAGYEHYEISNFARPGLRCLHNQLYSRNEDWLAIGHSASGHPREVRWKNVPHLGRYLAGEGGAPVQDVEQLSPAESVGEQLMMRLRLMEGVENGWLAENLDADRAGTLDRFFRDGWLWRSATHTGLSEKGLMVMDGLLAELV